MTYDEWKLETPEDEADRKALFWGALKLECPQCGKLNGPRNAECCNCSEPLTKEDAWEPDPDDARDDMQDREWNR
jgi:hypothetical protein